MNTIYRLVWSSVKNCWIVTSELARRVVKSASVGQNKTQAMIAAASLLTGTAVLAEPAANALPTGGRITAGSGNISSQGNAMTVQQHSQKIIANWQSFNIGSQASVTFKQPGSSSVALNRVTGQNPSQIMGQLNANGHVMLVSPAGVVFGKGSQVNVGGITASTLDINDADFLAGNYRFSNTGDAAAVENMGHILADGGVVAMVAPVVKNTGRIDTPNGSTVLAAADKVKLDYNGDGLISIATSKSKLDNLVENKGAIHAGNGLVVLSAAGADKLLSGVVSNKGIIEAKGINAQGGRIVLDGGAVTNTGTVNASSETHQGGKIEVAGRSLMMGGELNADGASGGQIKLASSGRTSLAEQIHAKGTAGKGGTINYQASQIIETSTGRTDVSGTTDGGKITVDGGRQLASSGQYRADGEQGRGGRIDLSAKDVRLLSTKISAKGQSEGGLVRVGGAFQGGKQADQTQSYYETFAGRWQQVASIDNADKTFFGDGSTIDVSSQAGQGGAAVVWSDQQTTFLGAIDAQGTTGGAVEVSSAQDLRKVKLNQITTGAGGHLLLDPKNIIIGTPATASSWSQVAVMGLGYGGIGLNPQDLFGSSVALNNTGDRLAVGAYNDDGDGNSATNSGAVYLFSFTDSNFSGATLQGIIGNGYSGGKNINITQDSFDRFGRSLALNGAGNRLAVGAFEDDGNGNSATNSGAVYLFTFTDTSFTGGSHVGTIGNGYSGGKNVNVSLENDDQFGGSLALNNSGDRLAVGAHNDDGNGNSVSNSGAVYLFSFSDTSFTGGSHVGTIGSGYSSGKNVNVTLDSGDQFGSSVALNNSGDRLAVGVRNDDGNGNGGSSESGAVYLFSFSNTSFTGGSHIGTIGSGYSGGKNINISLEGGDQFGWSLALNGAGDRLAVGSHGDDGNGNSVSNSGAVYLFTFTDTSFAGGSHVGTIGNGYSSGKNVNVTLDSDDRFGTSLAFNNAGDRLAVGAFWDDSNGNSVTNSGAVYLFTFTDTSFAGGSHVGTIGHGYSGGKGVNVSSLDSGDRFGFSLALNNTGNRLAVGAYNDNGDGNSVSNSGAVYLFSFTDSDFNGATLQGIIGNGYSGGKNVNVSLDADDWFGISVALNNSGDRLAVGASLDDGFGNSALNSGAVYLFSFTDTSFTGGSHLGTIGSGYSGGNNVNVSLDVGDEFGRSVALNGTGNRLAVGALKDDGFVNSVTDSGAVYLFTFTNTSFTGGSHIGTIGHGYSGGKDVDMQMLGSEDWFATSVALNDAGNRLAVGASLDDGFGNSALNSGAVYLFTFDDADFTNGSHVGTIGNGYSGTKDVNVSSLDNDNNFGVSVALNNSGDQLAVGAFNDDGSGNSVSNSGAVYLFSFTDTSFTGGSHTATIGKNYSGGNNVNVSLDAADQFGASVAFNGAGDRLAVGALGDDGNGNGTSAAGAVYLFTGSSGTSPSLTNANEFGEYPADTITLAASDIVAQLAAGTAVTLQASNDITVNTAVLLTGTPTSVGALTLQAGRSILLNNSISNTAGGQSGNITLIANETLANGVIDSHRDSGNAVFTMAAGTSINAGSSNVLIELRDGAGKTNTAAGDISLRNITANTIKVINNGPGTSSGIILNGTLTAAANSGNTIELAGDIFTNNTGASALSVTGPGRWLVWSANPTNDTRGGLSYNFKQYNATYGVTTVAQNTGNGFLYSLAPTITPGLTGTVSKIYNGNNTATLAAGNYSVSGAVDGDTVTLNNPTSGSYDNKNVGTGKAVTVNGLSIASASNGSATVYGYQLGSATANANIGEITAKLLTLTGISANNKVYDGTITATLTGSGSLSGIISGDTVTLGGSYTGSFADKNVGNNKAVTISGATLTGTDAGNYTLTGASAGTANITPASLTLTGISANNKVYDGTITATLTGSGSLSGIISGDTVTLGGSYTGSFADKNVGNNKAVTISGATLTGTDAGNYTLTGASAGTANITPASLTLTGISANNKVYDGTITATLTGSGSLSGIISGDTVTLGGSYTGSFADKNVGNNKAVTISGATLTGTDAGNYTLTGASAGTANITPASLTLTGISANNKVYDGTITATLTGSGSLSGIISGDTVTLGGSYTGSFADKNVGNNKAVTISGATLTGTDAGNYTLTGASVGTANITPASLTLTGIIANNKVYDGTTAATINSYGMLTGVIGSDSVLLDTGSASSNFLDPFPGIGKTVIINGLQLTGVDSGNYSILAQHTTANISSSTTNIIIKPPMEPEEGMVAFGDPFNPPCDYKLGESGFSCGGDTGGIEDTDSIWKRYPQ